MYTPSFEYHRAQSVAEAVDMLSRHSGAKLLAGGHSLLPLMKLRLADPGVLIDIGRIAALKEIGPTRDGGMRIGALATHAQIGAADFAPAAVIDAAHVIADVQVRNRGTIGGNIVHADPASDWPTVLTAFNAQIHLTGPHGDRTVSAAECFTGLFETDVGANEVLTEVRLPGTHAHGTGSAYVNLENPASRYAIVGAAAVVRVESGTCTLASVAVGGLTTHALLAPSVAAALVGKTPDATAIAAAAAAVHDDLGGDLIGDIHASAAYRRAIVPVYVRRALTAAVERAG